MGSNQSVQAIEDEEEEEEDEEEDDENGGNEQRDPDDVVEKKLLEQEPEMLPCYASASPLSPQLSSLGTPRMGPSIKVWDPYNVLAPPPPLPPPPTVSFGRSYSSDGMLIMEDDNRGGGLGLSLTEVYLISHGESEMSLRPDLIGGRCPNSGLTSNGKRQARALAVFLNSQGIRFNAVYCSPLDRAKATAASVCQELGFPEDQIRPMDALSDMSQGQWEGLPRSETYTPETLTLIERLQPDFSPPSGESLRQVEFRMVEFLHQTLLALPDKLKHPPNSAVHENHRDMGPGGPPVLQQWDLLHRHHRQLSRKKSGKSRLQVVTTTGDHHHHHYAESDDMSASSPREPSSSHRQNSICMTSSSTTSCVVGVFTHSVPIKCLLTAILGCSPVMCHKLCVEDSSVTVLQHSWKTGWQIKRLNETGHLRLL